MESVQRIPGVTESVAGFVPAVDFRDLPNEDVAKTKLLLLDLIGCALGSYVVDRNRLVLELVKELGGNPQATIIGSHRTSYALAAFANGELFNALDYDAIGPLTGHVCPFVAPSCLAAAEYAHSSGKELITALAIAHEIGGRVVSSMAQHKILKAEPPYYEEAERFTFANTIFGGVAGACRLLGLSKEETANALGMAGASTPVGAGIKWNYIDGPVIMVKYNAWTGHVAQLAAVAALLARKGFTGDTTIFDGEHGFWKIAGSPVFKKEVILAGLGEKWHLHEIEFKPYPTCRFNHAGIEAISKIVRENGLKPEDIKEIVVKGDPYLQTPNRMITDVRSFADMQFANIYIFAAAVLYGDKPSPAWLMPTTYNDPVVRALAGKIRIDKHPNSEEFIYEKVKMNRLPSFWNTIVEVFAEGGRKFSIEVKNPRGTVGNEMTETEITEKFFINASYSPICATRAEKIVEMCKGLENVDDVTQLTRLLVI
jgi:2-methylcitrate dehydratase PrpD